MELDVPVRSTTDLGLMAIPAARNNKYRTAPYAALLLRVTLGLMFIAHLYWKFEILPGGLHTWWSSLSANGYPPLVPWYVISAEFAGALLLIPRIYTRWISIYALPVMIGASHFWLARKGFYFTAAGGELGAAPRLGGDRYLIRDFGLVFLNRLSKASLVYPARWTRISFGSCGTTTIFRAAASNLI